MKWVAIGIKIVSWVSSTRVLCVENGAALRIEKKLATAGLETRRWWGKGAHAHPATARFPRTALRATEVLAEATLAVPFHRDLSSREIGRIVESCLLLSEGARPTSAQHFRSAARTSEGIYRVVIRISLASS